MTLAFRTRVTSKQELVARLGFKPLIHFSNDRKSNNIIIISISRIILKGLSCQGWGDRTFKWKVTSRGRVIHRSKTALFGCLLSLGHSARPLLRSFKAQEPWQTSVEGQLKKQQTGRGAAKQHAVRAHAMGPRLQWLLYQSSECGGCYSVSFPKWIFSTKPRLVT